MISQDLIDYIKSALASGQDTEAIKNELRVTGWANDDIDNAFVQVKSGSSDPAIVHTTPSGWHITKKEVFIAFAGIILLAAAGVAAYFVIPPTPEKIVKASTANLTTLRSFDYSGNLVVDISAPSGLFSLNTLVYGLPTPSTNSNIAGATDTKFAMDFSGSADISDANNPKSDVNLNFNYSVFNFGLEMRLLDKIVYLKFSNLPKVPSYDLSAYSGVWIKIDPNDIAQEYGVDVSATGKPADLTDGQKQELIKLAENSHFYNSITKLADDKINGNAMYHYSVDVDMNGVRNYFHQVEQIENSTQTTDTDLQNLSINNAEIWVGKSDKMIYRVSGQITEAPDPGTTTVPASGSINVVLNMKNFNQASSIIAPTDYKNFADVLKEFTQNLTTQEEQNQTPAK